MDKQNDKPIDEMIMELIDSFNSLNKNVQILTNMLKEKSLNKNNNKKYNNDRKSLNRPTSRNIINSIQCKGITSKGNCMLLTKDSSGFCRFHKNNEQKIKENINNKNNKRMGIYINN